MKLLETLEATEVTEILNWCKAQPLAEMTKSSYVKGRLEKWYHLGSNLQSVAMKRGEVFRAPEAPKFITEIGDYYLPGWNSLLVCGGPTSIGWHRDHGHFFGPAVMINLGEAIYNEALARHENPTVILKDHMHKLSDGDIVWIDTKFSHSSEQISPVRYNLTFRTIKPEYLTNIKDKE